MRAILYPGIFLFVSQNSGWTLKILGRIFWYCFTSVKPKECTLSLCATIDEVPAKVERKNSGENLFNAFYQQAEIHSELKESGRYFFLLNSILDFSVPARALLCNRTSGMACFAIYRFSWHLNLWKMIDGQGVRIEHLHNRFFTTASNGKNR